MTSVDYGRVVIYLMFGLTLGETAWIVRVYFLLAVTGRRLLPTHVFLIGVSTMMFEIEAVWQNAERWGDGWTWYVPYNLVGFLLLYASLVTIRLHVTRRRRHQQLATAEALYPEGTTT